MKCGVAALSFVTLLVTILAAPATRASCAAPFVFATLEIGNSYVYSYIYTPGVDPTTSASGYSVTDSFEGFFWALGFGDPAIGLGHDNGRWAGDDDRGWFYLTPGYPALLLGTWAGGPADGCIAETPLPVRDNCMALLLTDQHESVGYFTAMTRSPTDALDYEFLLPDNTPFILAPIPPPVVVAEERIGPTRTAVTVAPPLLDGGLYLAPECATLGDMPVGYRVYRQSLPDTAAEPTDRALRAGWSNPTPVIDLDSEAVLTVPCDDDRLTFLATTLVFDSGFETPVASANAPPLTCRRCTAGVDADGDGSCTVSADGGPIDCDDADPHVFPHAPERCDGVENDCLAPGWPLAPPGEADNDADGFRQCDGDCADGDAFRFPGAGETCNGLDDDCDGTIDEDATGVDSDGDGIRNVCDNCPATANPDQTDGDADGLGGACDRCSDRDGDGWGVPGSVDCPGGATTDCDDLDWITLPGGLEYDDGKDNDCNGSIDDGVDADGDGVPDFRDVCPDTPPGGGTDASGCDVCSAPATDDSVGSRESNRLRQSVEPPLERTRRRP